MSIILPAQPPTSPAPEPVTCNPWATRTDVTGTHTVDNGLLDDCLQAASDVLFVLSGCQFPGICSDRVRPRARPSGRDCPGGCSWHHATNACGCGGSREMELGGRPIVSIDLVKADGRTLVAGVDYRIDDESWLVRLGGAAWPCCQDPLLDEDALGATVVAYTFGRPPPPMGRRAAAVLGYELALSATPPVAKECRLPKRVTQVTRQGITAVALDPWSFLDKGRTGLYEVDLFLTAENPHGNRAAATAGRPEWGDRVRRPASR